MIRYKLSVFAVGLALGWHALWPSLAGAPKAYGSEDALVVIVHPSNPVSNLSTHQVSDLYFKRVLEWPDGQKVKFIDQRDGSPRRVLFARRVLRRTPRDIDLFWIGQKNFTGRSAPVQAPSDELVISMVASLPGAIGYVSERHPGLGRVKRVQVIGSD